MRITGISLKNFRSFKQKQHLELAPVTLLFGANSVGKSSVLMALAYVHQVLKKGHCDPQYLDAIGDKRIGGFRSLVYGQDLNESIVIRIDFESDSGFFDRYETSVDVLSNVMNASHLLMDNFSGQVRNCGVELEISWSDAYSRAYVKKYRVWANGKYVGCIESSEDSRDTKITEVNAGHPLFIPYNHDDWLESEYGQEALEAEPLEPDEYHTEFEKVVNGLNSSGSTKSTVICDEESGEEFVNRIAPLSISCEKAGAIPVLGEMLESSLEGEYSDEAQEHLDYLVVTSILSQAFVQPLDELLHYLDTSIFIGPLRVVPDMDYLANPHPEQKDWIDGTAAWDLLHKDVSKDKATADILERTSNWFSSKDGLNAGYTLENHSVGELSSIANDAAHAGILNEQLNKRHVYFKDVSTGMKLSANQLGTGISQVLPIIVAANMPNVGVVSVEQPELHIHPRFQVQLADLFLGENVSHLQKRVFLIETHSEHIMLRLLRRVRESLADTKSTENVAVNTSDISVLYLTSTENGVAVEKINVTEDGDFDREWPHGFFEERDEELF